MSSLECVNESEAMLSEPDPTAKLRNRVYMGFAGTMALGFSLAGWYVGGRILAAEQASPPVTLARPAVISPSPPSAAPVVTANDSSAPFQPVPAADLPPQVVAPPAAPPAPQVFLEVAGLGAKPDALYVKRLRAKGFSARIDIGDKADDRRILIGPFADPQAVGKAQRKLQAEGILALERTY